MANNDPELSAEARQVIADARGLDEPTSEDRARVRTLWLTGIAAAAGVSALGQAAHAAGTAWGLKAMGVALAVAAGVAGIYVALPGDDGRPVDATVSPTPAVSPSQAEVGKVVVPSAPSVAETLPPEAATPPPVALAPTGIEPASVQPSPVEKPMARPSPPITAAPPRLPASAAATPLVVASKSEPVAREATAASANVAAEGGSARAAVPQQSGQLGEELALLSKIRSSVQEGAGARALELLGEYKSRFERPVLGMEAAALRIDALCQSGQRDAARASAEAFQGTWPGSPLEQRVRSACP